MMKAMLAKTTTDQDELINDDEWVAEEKLDGQRFLVKVVDCEASCFNRKGEELNIPTHIAASFDHNGFQGTWIFDGELVEDIYTIFDILMIRDQDITNKSWSLRKGAMDAIKSIWLPPEFIRFTRSHESSQDKERLIRTVINEGLEGVVFKNKQSTYKPGKSNLWLKYKITDTCDALVIELNRKGKIQAVTIGLYHNDELISVGGLKIPVDMVGKIELDTVVEVRYLYSTADIKLYQPVFLRTRQDKNSLECTTDQLER